MAKAFTAEAAVEVTGESIQIHGGVGFTWDCDAHHFYRRVKQNDLLLGYQAGSGSGWPTWCSPQPEPGPYDTIGQGYSRHSSSEAPDPRGVLDGPPVESRPVTLRKTFLIPFLAPRLPRELQRRRRRRRSG